MTPIKIQPEKLVVPLFVEKPIGVGKITCGDPAITPLRVIVHYEIRVIGSLRVIALPGGHVRKQCIGTKLPGERPCPAPFLLYLVISQTGKAALRERVYNSV